MDFEEDTVIGWIGNGVEVDDVEVLSSLLSAHTTRRIHATAPATSSRLFVVSRFSPFKRFAPKAPPSLCSQTL